MLEILLKFCDWDLFQVTQTNHEYMCKHILLKDVPNIFVYTNNFGVEIQLEIVSVMYKIVTYMIANCMSFA